MDQVLLFGQHEFRHAAIALPAVGAPVLLAGAGDHVAAPAVLADAAAGNVIHDHALALAEPPAAGTGLDNLPARLVARDHALVALRTLAEMLVIDTPDIRPANRRRLHAQQHFAVAGRGHGNFLQLDGAVAGQVRASHCLITPSRSQRSSQLCPAFHKNTWPLMRRQFRSTPAMARISSAVSGAPT